MPDTARPVRNRRIVSFVSRDVAEALEARAGAEDRSLSHVVARILNASINGEAAPADGLSQARVAARDRVPA